MESISSVVLELSLLAAISAPISASAQEESKFGKTYLMAAMGDSITAGFLASTSLDWFNGNESSMEAQSQELAATIEALGNGNDRAIDWEGYFASFLESRKTHSWATGRLIPSQFVLLKEHINKTEPKAKVAALNVAVSGGFTSDLFGQADKIVRLMKYGHFDSLKYVTLLIGNNDACHDEDKTKMKSDLHEVFRRLSTIKQAEPIRIMMSGLPRIPDLGKKSVQDSQTIFHYSCKFLRQTKTKNCLPLTTWSQDKQYEVLVQYIQGVNEALSQVAEAANVEFKNLDIHFSDSIFNQDIDRDNLAIDCFHPNKGSQKRLSETLWKDQPWFK